MITADIIKCEHVEAFFNERIFAATPLMITADIIKCEHVEAFFNERIFAATPLMITAFIIPANHHYNKHTWQPGPGIQYKIF